MLGIAQLKALTQRGLQGERQGRRAGVREEGEKGLGRQVGHRSRKRRRCTLGYTRDSGTPWQPLTAWACHAQRWDRRTWDGVKSGPKGGQQKAEQEQEASAVDGGADGLLLG